MTVALSPVVKVAWDQSELVLDARLHLDLAGERERWNGFVCPEFDRENVQRIMDYNAASDIVRVVEQLSWEGDTVVSRQPDYPEDAPDRIEPMVDDAGVTRWGIGAWYWTWYVVPTITCPECGHKFTERSKTI